MPVVAHYHLPKSTVQGSSRATTTCPLWTLHITRDERVPARLSQTKTAQRRERQLSLVVETNLAQLTALSRICMGGKLDSTQSIVLTGRGGPDSAVHKRYMLQLLHR
jgi:hypothetical protein